MNKTIDLSVPVYTLIQKDPALKGILKEAGFSKITNPAALNTVGRLVSIEQGASMQFIPLDHICSVLEKHGYTVSNRTGQLKEMLNRLNQGEDLEKVREDFAREFESVSVQEIMDAEQSLMEEGVPEAQIQSLCDLHSALFHGKTEAEVLLEEMQAQQYLIGLLKAENRELEKRLARLERELEHPQENFDEISQLLKGLGALKAHYAKKEELIMPYLYAYGITGPSTVMWGVDDEILKTLRQLSKTVTRDNIIESLPQIAAVIQRMREMIYKEEQILYPMAEQNLSEQDWLSAYGDIDEYGTPWLENYPKWQQGEEWLNAHPFQFEDREIHLPTGTMTLKQLSRMLDVLPVDITYIDENDDLIFFTNQEKIFARPKAALKRRVILCHPPRIIPVVEKMLADFKEHKKDRVERWIPMSGNPVKVVYQAVYDENGIYKGTVETVQSFGGDLKTLVRLAENGKPNE